MELAQQQQDDAAIWRWYVARTEPQRERCAAAWLTGWRIKAYLPELPCRRLAGRKMQIVRMPMFPGYLFVSLVEGSEPWHRIRMTPGILVHDPVLRADGRYRPIPTKAIEIIQEVERQETEEPKGKNALFYKGQSVVVASNASNFAIFEDFRAVVEDISRLDRKGRIRVAAEWLGRLVSIEVRASQIRVA